MWQAHEVTPYHSSHTRSLTEEAEGMCGIKRCDRREYANKDFLIKVS